MQRRFKSRMASYKKGLWAENLAHLYLWVKGYRILARRYKVAVGEIDLIAMRGNVLVFVEVKARKTRQAALESITPKTRRRITNAAKYYLTTCNGKNDVRGGDHQIRFDVICVLSPFKIHHLDNAWQVTA